MTDSLKDLTVVEMDRRDLLNLAVRAAAGAVIPKGVLAAGRDPKEMNLTKLAQATAPPTIIAGIRLPDSAIAKVATEFSREASPEFLFHHAARTFVFGALIGHSMQLKFDVEALYLACILHDLGLTESFAGPLPFELQGAQIAKEFLVKHGYAADRAELVWDGIAMHPSRIAEFKVPEIMLVARGAAADVLGPDPKQLNKSIVDEVVSVLPRLDFKRAFLKSCADVIRKYPDGATRSFMRDVGERYVSTFDPHNFCDAELAAPFLE